MKIKEFILLLASLLCNVIVCLLGILVYNNSSLYIVSIITLTVLIIITNIGVLCLQETCLILLMIILEIGTCIVILLTNLYVILIIEFIAACLNVIVMHTIYRQRNDEEVEVEIHHPPRPPTGIVCKSEISINCQICLEETKIYIKPDPNVSLCTCTNFVLCESCFSKIDNKKCPFCRMALIV